MNGAVTPELQSLRHSLQELGRACDRVEATVRRVAVGGHSSDRGGRQLLHSPGKPGGDSGTNERPPAIQPMPESGVERGRSQDDVLEVQHRGTSPQGWGAQAATQQGRGVLATLRSWLRRIFS